MVLHPARPNMTMVKTISRTFMSIPSTFSVIVTHQLTLSRHKNKVDYP
jgi:hypothetical protein